MTKVTSEPHIQYHSCLFTLLMPLRINWKIAANSNNDQGKNAQSVVCTKKKGSPLPFIGPVAKNRPNWLSQKNQRIPDTPVRPKTTFSGCRSNCLWRQYNSGRMKIKVNIMAMIQRHLNKVFQFFLMSKFPAMAPPIGIMANMPLVMMEQAAKMQPINRCQ